MNGSKRSLKISILAILSLALCLGVTASFAGTSNQEKTSATPGKTFAQKLLDNATAKHPELTGLEMAATAPGGVCKTIAATEAKELGEKCDKDEFTALRTGKPFVEKEEDGFDITLPLHDAAGKLVGTLGMDFKPEPGQQESEVVARAQQIADELAKQISSKAKLFEPAK